MDVNKASCIRCGRVIFCGFVFTIKGGKLRSGICNKCVAAVTVQLITHGDQQTIDTVKKSLKERG